MRRKQYGRPNEVCYKERAPKKEYIKTSNKQNLVGSITAKLYPYKGESLTRRERRKECKWKFGYIY